MGRVCLGLAMGLLLVSCGQEAPETAPEEVPAPEVTTPAPAASHASGARTVVEETDDFLFEYSYPAEAGNIAELATLLDRRLDRLRNALAADAAEARDDARDNGFPYNKYSTGIEWKVVAETPEFLSMSANLTSYSGGAHGNYGFDALVWDKAQGRVLKPESFFTTPEALDAALGARLCDLLNRERAVRRGAEIEKGSTDMFDACVPIADTTVLLGSSNGRTFDRIGVQIGPYVAGAYAEGAYEFTIPVDDALIVAVREEYRPFFSSRS